ncbi:MAG: nitrous oxide reductase accessory protein NosL [Deltaproteobacteria bacterium]|nr:nitrous oxide reductase accessory protein NosL [Deltaproteobacteria bacterium]
MKLILKKSILLFLMVFLFTACGRSQPVDIRANEHLCEHCKMGIVEMRFKTQILSLKGKPHFFDSIECLFEWAVQHSKEIQSRWVTDFLHPEKWIRLEKAFILKSKNIPSPMGGYLSAYSSMEDFTQAQKGSGGEWIHPNNP